MKSGAVKPDPAILSRWRLILGESAEKEGLEYQDGEAREAGEVVDFLFAPGGAKPKKGRRKRSAGTEPGHAMTVPTWVDAVQRLFPRQVKEVMERELIRRRGLEELLSKPELLEKVEPNVELVKTLLTHRNLVKPETRVLIRKIVAKVVQDLQEKIRLQVEPAIVGALRRDRHSPRALFRHLDWSRTLRRNLHNWDEEREKLLIDRAYFFAAERNRRPWHVIIAVDQSGSMLESAIFSTVMASIFHQLPSMRTSLYLFDTEIVDLSDQVNQPVDVLLQVQLGGGTHISRALRYGRGLVREPGRTVLVLISDFFEGGAEIDLVRETQELADSGVRMIGLGALGFDARPEYNRRMAGKLRKVGMDILVCTPERLAECIGEIIKN